MDGHEFADALLAGQVTAEQVASGLRRFQHFLDRYLHGPLEERGFEAVGSSWHDFPPAALGPLTSIPI